MQNMQQQWSESYLFGANGEFVEELYELYLENKTNVDNAWQAYFDSLQEGSHKDVNHHLIKQKFVQLTRSSTAGEASAEVLNASQTKVYGLIASYRAWGHKFAKLDPLQRQELTRPSELDYHHYALDDELENEFYDDYDLRRAKLSKLKDIIMHYEAIYCTSSGFEFAHISNIQEQEWLTQYVESKYTNYTLSATEKKQILQKLTEADGLERFLNTRYVGQKRFSLEGGDSLIPLLDRLISKGAKQGINDISLGMAHRGRLNTLVNIVGKSPAKLFAEFDGNYPHYDFVTSGDVKYHKGYACEYVLDDKTKVKVSLAYNPSHLEVVNPVLQGMVRAKQDKLISDKESVLGVLIHGDSALIGLGTNQGIFNMSNTRAYGVLGMVHLVINNQVGFTTSRVNDNRSSRYCTDIAKMIEAPILHVNGDDIRALMFALDLAIDYRQLFKRDIILDLYCFRRHGHNEADDPTLTQPLMYAKIKQHIGIRALYAKQLIAEGIISAKDESDMVDAYRLGLTKGEHINQQYMLALPRYTYTTSAILKATWDDKVNTKISQKKFTELAKKITALPTDASFKLHPAIIKLNEARKNMAKAEQKLDFSMAETMAYAAILDAGISVRISGEDAMRGTFTHRQAAWHNMERKKLSEGIYFPLANVQNKSKFEIYDSVLNEECVLGFEYGYSLEAIQNLTIWEAQFGDFANGAQVIIDQFISSAEVKWGNLSRLALLLPHGYDGAGPEHSSARVERFLQLAAENNLLIAIPSSAAQFFHLLQKQVKFNYVKPLIVFVSKKLLRLKEAMSEISEITQGEYLALISDEVAKKTATKIVICSGQIYYELLAARATRKLEAKVVLLRLEQLYPLPIAQIKHELAKYSKAQEFIWAQEEPYNQGAWLQIRENLDTCLTRGRFSSATRARAAAPACGGTTMHNQQLADLINLIFGS